MADEAAAVPTPMDVSDGVVPGNRLFVGNLQADVTDGDLLALFSVYGKCVVRLIHDKETGRSKGFAFVEFEDDACADVALAAMNDALLDGRRIRVDKVVPR